MDITARLAATMHYFSGERSKITRDTLERAFNIVLWHLDEYKYLFSSDFMMPQDEVDAYAEAGWLLKNRWGGIYSDSRVTRRDWLKNGDTRIANRLNAALPFLVADGAVQLIGGMSTSDPNAEFRLMNHYFANLKL